MTNFHTVKEQRYRPSADVATEAVADGLLLVQLVEGATYRLNGTGRAIWELAAAGCTTEEIAQRLQARFAVAPERLAADAAALLAELTRSALLKLSDEHRA